jgi:hypothetical protein
MVFAATNGGWLMRITTSSRVGGKMFFRSYRASRLCLLVILGVAFAGASLHAQTIDDALMIPRRQLFTGALYSHDSWNHYWEGDLYRTNGNLGTVTTQAVTWSGNYGITDRFDVIVEVPYVWTHSSQGVLHSMHGFQDLTIAGKYNVLDRRFTRYGRFRAFGVVVGGIPMTDYSPDFLPLSIGLGSKRIAARGTVNFQSDRGWFLTGSTAYTWRDNVTLNRSTYFTNGQLYLTNQVQMPNVFDYITSGGWLSRGRMAQFSFFQQRTLGGGDIRRQDMPFVSNKMNLSQISGMVMYPMPGDLHNLSYQFTYGYVISGRNVGQSSTFTTGFQYTIHFERGPRS